MRRISSWRRSSVVGLPLSVVVSQLSATVGQMQTSPTIEPSGCGRANATTSVSPRRPVARRFRRCIAGAPSSVNSTRTSRAPSQASTRRATRSNVPSETRRLRGRLPTGVALVFPARGPVTLLLGAVVEIGDLAGAMMLRDERGHDRGEASLLGKGEAVGHVALDDLRRLRRRNLVVRIAAARLVFDEIQRVAEFPDVVVVAAHAAQQAV